VFDAVYYGFGLALAVAVLATALTALWLRDRSAEALGIAAASSGLGLALVSGFALNAVRVTTGDLVYQQVHFAGFYVAFGLVLLGADLVIGAARRVRVFGWLSFASTVLIAGWFLLHAGDYAVATGGSLHVPQQIVYFLPLYFVLGAAMSASIVLAAIDPRRRITLALLAGFAALILVGMLRESNVISSSGVPLLDLIIAFGPFTAGAVALWLAALSLPHAPRLATEEGFEPSIFTNARRG
jgi:hypothetical protein